MAALTSICLLVLLLPFEPMSPLFAILGFELSFLEFSAAILFAVTAGLLLFPRAGGLKIAMPLMGFAVAFLVACLLSTYWAEPPRSLPLKATLRVAAGVAAFALTAWALVRSTRMSAASLLLGSFAAAGLFTASVGLLEVVSLPSIEALLAPFREHNFEVGGTARIAATFPYPNTAAGFLVLTLPAALFFVARDNASRRSIALASATALIMFTAILFTYSRGALLGALGATALLWLWLWRRGHPATGRIGRFEIAFLLLALIVTFDVPTFRWRAASEGDGGWYRASLQPVEQELELEPGGLATTMVGVRNTGKTTWGSEGDEPVYLSYRWFVAKEDGSLDPLPIEGERTPLPRAVAPDETVVVRASVSVSAGRGRYILIWDMVHADKLWFSDKAGLGSPVRVLVGEEDGFSELPRPEDVRDRLAREAWRPGRWELWGLALTLFKDNPILGIGPDNFRWSYGPAAGRSTWDTRTFSNSLYLETLATTGLVGAVIFFSLVASVALGASSRGGFERGVPCQFCRSCRPGRVVLASGFLDSRGVRLPSRIYIYLSGFLDPAGQLCRPHSR